MDLSHGMTIHEVSSIYRSRFGSISLPTWLKPRFSSWAMITKCLHGISNSFQHRPAPHTWSLFAGLQAKSSAQVSLLWCVVSGHRIRGSKWAPCPHPWNQQCAGGKKCSSELKARRGSTQTHVLQGMGSPGPPAWASEMTHQHPVMGSARGTSPTEDQ